ncbi:MAG: helix-turn-helix transcriptional regulator [Aphanocapsa sp. GSE-SYN-MK-11-07L]|jgi:putative transcriptional regulator|nr:helix-turn-helix transcriptional regulator [Aphanocapsa sp. GSE-SYN-MK-11-07L]
MSAVLSAPRVSKVRWKLRLVMADRKITNKALAEAVAMNPVSISKLKNADSLPEIGGDTLAKLCDAITALSGIPCSLSELIEYIPD